MVTSRWIILRMRNVWDKCCKLSNNTHFRFNNSPPPPPKKNLYRLWRNVGNYVTAGQATYDSVTLRMRIAFCVSKATNTHSEYVIVIAFPQRWLLVRASVFYAYTYTPTNKNPSVWNFLSPELEVTWRTVAIIIRVVPIFAHSWRFSVFHPLQSITPRIY